MDVTSLQIQQFMKKLLSSISSEQDNPITKSLNLSQFTMECIIQQILFAKDNILHQGFYYNIFQLF